MNQYPVLIDDFQTRVLEVGAGQPMLMLHGLGARADRWVPTMKLVEQRGGRAVAIDLPGHGFADKSYDYVDLGVLSGAVHRVIRELALKDLWIVGTSLGGLVAARVMADDPANVLRATLVGSLGIEPLGRDRCEGIARRSFDRSREGVRAKLEHALYDVSVITPEWIAEETRINNSRHTDRFFTAVGDYIGTRIDRDAHIPEIIAALGATRFQLIWGREDRTVPLDVATRFADGVDGLAVDVIDNASHMPYFEQPDAFVSALLSGQVGANSQKVRT